MSETVLVVDDEDGVRRTLADWLRGAGWGLTVLVAADAEAALRQADQQPIDLAILDWNLGSGADGLQLLEDLTLFQPELVAILVTGFAGQATPLQALRMGVRDYLDKNQDLTRETFLRAIERQLSKIRPAKRQRALTQSLAQFQDAVRSILPLVRTTATFHDPVPLPAAVHTLFRFLLRATGATDGILLVRHYDDQGQDETTAYAPNGAVLPAVQVPFHRMLAASVATMQDPAIMNHFQPEVGLVDLLPWEEGRRSILAAPVRLGPGLNVVLELFDKPAFTEEDRRLVATAAELGSDLLKQALAERQTQRLLFDAVEGALEASAAMQATLSDATRPTATTPSEPVATAAALDRLRAGLAQDPNALADAETTLAFVQAVHTLAQRHGPAALTHCLKLVQDLNRLLDELMGPHG